jgi:putative RNA 2'-phosphotransferase
MDNKERTRLSKALTRVLRHQPWLYELELDEHGWTHVEPVLEGLRPERSDWAALTAESLAEVVAMSTQNRFEMDGNRIRALYGHSIPGRIDKTPAQPPEALYHGTPPDIMPIIQADGLKPMSRQYVHMSVQEHIAHEVGKRKASTTMMLVIRALEAYQSGIAFYRGNDFVWLADFVPAQFIQFPDQPC